MAEEIIAGGITVPLSHPDKVLFPGDGITKEDLARYYADVADRMLPWLRDRPITMIRYPDGLGGQRFFQKNAPSYFPDWIRRVEVAKEGLPSFVRTSGGRGLHVHVPLTRRADFDAVREFARRASDVLARRHPDVITTEQRKDKREMRIYADVMRNAYAQTVAASYGVRARPGAPVATPLSWAEVEHDTVEPGQFTMATIRARLDGGRDPWAAFDGSRHGLGEAEKRLAKAEA